LPAQLGQMLGQARLRQADDFLQFADALFAPGQLAYNEQAVGIAHRLENRIRLLNVAVDWFQVKPPPFNLSDIPYLWLNNGRPRSK
jgi:hypothetical protein